jgi:hypothetical protein
MIWLIIIGIILFGIILYKYENYKKMKTNIYSENPIQVPLGIGYDRRNAILHKDNLFYEDELEGKNVDYVDNFYIKEDNNNLVDRYNQYSTSFFNLQNDGKINFQLTSIL